MEFCSDIENHTTHPLYTTIEQEVVHFNSIIALTTNLVPLLLSLYIGSWSDRFGRKPFLGQALSPGRRREKESHFIMILNPALTSQSRAW